MHDGLRNLIFEFTCLFSSLGKSQKNEKEKKKGRELTTFLFCFVSRFKIYKFKLKAHVTIINKFLL